MPLKLRDEFSYHCRPGPDKAEDAFRQSMLMSRGSLGIFFSNTLVTTLVFLGVALLVLPVIWQALGKMLARSPIRP
jgi:putative tricarboxylic transport membrane protein